MPRYPRSGVTKLSELAIDAEKDWGYMRIKHLPEPVNGTEPMLQDAFHGLAKITVGTTPDPTPSVGDLWVETT